MDNKKLLVATDLSDAAYNALMCAVGIAKKLNSEIILLHVFEVADVDENARRLISSSFLNREIKRQLQEICDTVQSEHGIKSTYLTKEGDLFKLLGGTANETNSDILFVGTHGVQGVQHITGSFIAKTINLSPVPVWVVQKETPLKAYENIYVLIDEMFDNPGHNTILDLAKMFNAKLNFVFTEPPSAYSVSDITNKIKTMVQNTNLACDIISIAEEMDKTKSLIDLAYSGASPLIIINRNGSDADNFVGLVTNKCHIEVLCLNG